MPNKICQKALRGWPVEVLALSQDAYEEADLTQARMVPGNKEQG